MNARSSWLLVLIGILAAQVGSAQTSVTLETSKGKIVIELLSEESPQTVKNFLSYVQSGHYNGTIFHRVIPRFMIQGGGFSADLKQKPTQDPVMNESKNGVNNKRGTVAMARRRDPHSATAQFFINTEDNPALDAAQSVDGWGYTVFGKVTQGMDVVDAISQIETTDKGEGHQNVPVEAVWIEKASVKP